MDSVCEHPFRDIPGGCKAWNQASCHLTFTCLTVEQLCGVAAYGLAAPSMCFNDVTSPALRGLPPHCFRNVDRSCSQYPQAAPGNLHSTRPGQPPPRRGHPQESGGTSARPMRLNRRVPSNACSAGERGLVSCHSTTASQRRSWDLSWDFRIPSATSGSEFGTRALASFANSRVCLTRHLPLSPFLTASGACTSDPFAALFHAAPLMGFPSPVLEGMKTSATRRPQPEGRKAGSALAHILADQIHGPPRPPGGGEARSGHPEGLAYPTRKPPGAESRRSVRRQPGHAHLHRRRTDGRGRTQGGSP